MQWRIYYGDGSTYSDRDGPPQDAPGRDVQVIARKYDNPRGFSLMHGKDAFVWRNEGWCAVDIAGLWDYLLNYPGWQKVIFGRNAPDKVYKDIVGKAGKEGLG